ncbi:MAG TPA: hypothetical protein VH087_04665 [Thermoanaerobaculia bacterium]|jgi:hypothetical protein|nr:hypothetical protein [Thermoanaerobaculia bacterium]
MATGRPADTSERADEVQFAILRGMTVQQRAAVFTQLCLSVQELAIAGLRREHPNASEDELRLRLAARTLGNDVVRRVWNWSPDEP